MKVAVLELDGNSYVTRREGSLVDVSQPARLRLDLAEVIRPTGQTL